MRQQGFTIPELLVGITIFSLIAGVTATMILSAISAQQIFYAKQGLLNQTPYTAEYMSRAIRQAQKELGSPPTCLTSAGRGANYELINELDGVGSGIKFMNRSGDCQEFFLEDGAIQERVNGASQVRLTGEDALVGAFHVWISGAGQDDNIQPRVTFYMGLEDLTSKESLRPTIELQTTVSQRRIDARN